MIPIRRLFIKTKRGYHRNVLDHYENPRNIGSLNSKDKNVGTGLVGAPACGDVMKINIRVDEDGVIIETLYKLIDFRINSNILN